MRALYGRHFAARYEALDALIPGGASVVEVCAGDCRLYQRYLRGRIADYLAIDASPPFVDAARRRGIRAEQLDLREAAIPPADYIVMQASLYQFLPDAEPVVRKLIAAARKQAIVAEPIRNLSDAQIPVLSWMSSLLTKPTAGAEQYSGGRFNRETLSALCERVGGIEQTFLIPGGREQVYVFRGGASV